MSKFFDKWAPYYEALTGEIFFRGIRDEIVRFSKATSGDKVLDIGSGPGCQSKAFAELGCQVTGVDTSEGMLHVARKEQDYENVTFCKEDAADLSFEDDFFDVSVICFLLHHLPPSVWSNVLKEAMRVTKNEGFVLVSDYYLQDDSFFKSFMHSFLLLAEGEYYERYSTTDITYFLSQFGKLKVRTWGFGDMFGIWRIKGINI